MVDDDAAVLLLPIPDALQELFASKVVAGLFFFFAKTAFDDGLSGDPGVICAWKPKNLVPSLPRAAGKNVLQSVVENMPECEYASHIRWRNHDGESGFG